MRKTLFTLIALPFLALANDQLEKEIDSCKSLTDSTQRLACYDKIFEKKTESSIDKNAMGKWFVQQGVSPVDDSKSVTIRLNADRPINARYNLITPHLYIRCKENVTELYIDFDTFLRSNDLTPITRIDSEKAVSNRRWNISNDHKAIFYPSTRSKKTTDFIKDLIGKNKLFIQVTPYGESAVNTTFTLTGLDEAIKPLRETCGW